MASGEWKGGDFSRSPFHGAVFSSSRLFIKGGGMMSRNKRKKKRPGQAFTPIPRERALVLYGEEDGFALRPLVQEAEKDLAARESVAIAKREAALVETRKRCPRNHSAREGRQGSGAGA